MLLICRQASNKTISKEKWIKGTSIYPVVRIIATDSEHLYVKIVYSIHLSG
jgi:hypothetical protein